MGTSDIRWRRPNRKGRPRPSSLAGMWITQRSSRRTGPLMLASMTTALLLIASEPVAASPWSTSAGPAEEPEVPVLGQTAGGQSMSIHGAKSEALISLHGVRRTESSTVVYWSAGWTPDTKSGDQADLTNTFGHSLARLGLVRPDGEPMADVAVVDLEGQRAYTPVIDDGSCLCSDFLDALPSDSEDGVGPPPGKAYVMYAVLPELPKDLDTASVKVAGKVFTDVPVDNGAMTPEVDAEESILIGTGWPKVQTSDIQDIDDLNRFIYPLSKNSALLNSAVSSRDDKKATNIDIASDVLFNVDKDNLTSKAKKEIKAAAKEVKGAKGDKAAATITITGHTDSDGADRHNQKLSERRAKAVAKEIEPLLPNSVEITTAGKGETEPIESNGTNAGKAKNRRVTITVPGGSE